MGMTNKQFQAFIRLLDLVRILIKKIPIEEQEQAEKELEQTIQLIKEDSFRPLSGTAFLKYHLRNPA